MVGKENLLSQKFQSGETFTSGVTDAEFQKGCIVLSSQVAKQFTL